MEKYNMKHVLLVDNDPATRRLFGSLLGRAGFEVLYAKDGNEGREMARRFLPDLILLDYNMPIMDGLETAQRLKTEPGSPNIDTPIALLTNEDISMEGQKAIKELGIIDYIQKGVSNEEFIIRVKKILNMPTE